MPRIRGIKPKFFVDSKIGALKPLARLFFVGLWCHSDRLGRLEDDPEELEIQIIPYDARRGAVTATDLLKELEPQFIQRYEAKGKKYIQILHFLDHQRPHHTEVKSTIPAPPAQKTVTAPLLDGEYRVEKEKEKEKEKERTPLSAGSTGFRPRDLATLWNDTASRLLPRVQELSPKRMAKIRVRLKEHPEKSWWVRVIKLVNESDFCRGLKNRSHWKVSFDFLITNAENAVKVSEGNYGNEGLDAGKCIVCKERPVRGPQSKLCIQCAHCSKCGNNIGQVKIVKRPKDGTLTVICAGGCREERAPAAGRCLKCGGRGGLPKAVLGLEPGGWDKCTECGGTGKAKPKPASAGAVLSDMGLGRKDDPAKETTATNTDKEKDITEESRTRGAAWPT